MVTTCLTAPHNFPSQLPTLKHIPHYIRWLSYLSEQVLETTASPYNEFLQVRLVRGQYQLVAEDAIYSFGNYYHNFRATFDRLRFDLLPPRASVLVLGLGLGSIPELLEKTYRHQYEYVAVEIDPVIIQLATEYTLPSFSSPIEVVQADAYQFVQVDERQFDLVCVDVFQDATVPLHLIGAPFLALLEATLRPGGALIFNRLADNAEHREEAQSYFEEYFVKHFPAGEVVNTGGNLMLINEARFVEPRK